MAKSKPWLMVRTLIITYVISGLLMVLLARFVWGFLTGLLYFAALFFMSFLQNGGVSGDTVHTLTVLAMCALSGMAGGMMS